MDITFEDVAHVIQDARYQQAILDTTPRPDKRIPPIGRNFSLQSFCERFDTSCRAVISEPLGRWFLDKFADLDEKVAEAENPGMEKSNREESKFIDFVELVYEIKRQDPGGVAPFMEVLRLLKDYKLDRLAAVKEFLKNGPAERETLSNALSEAQADFEDDDGIASSPSIAEEDLDGGDEGGIESREGSFDGSIGGATEESVTLVTKDGKPLDNPAETGEGNTASVVEAETEVSRYDPNKPLKGTNYAGTTGARNRSTTGNSRLLMAARTGLNMRVHRQRSIDLNEALEELMVGICQPIYDRFIENKTMFAQYARFKEFAVRPISDRQIRYHRVLGQGAFGTVHGCLVAQTGTILAMKLMSKKKIKLKHSRSQVVAERLALETLARHPSPYCMYLRYAFETKDAFHLIIPLAIGGDLKFHLRAGPFDEKRAKFYAAEIAAGVGHIHSLGFIMRDLKPRNILLDSDGHVKISDFGLAASIARGNLVKGRAGTEGYWSPEVINGLPYGVDADWWSFGCCVFELLTAFNPFSTKHTGFPTRNQGTRTANIKFPKSVPGTAKTLILALLDRNVEARLGSKKGVEEILNPKQFSFWGGLDLRRIKMGNHPVPWVPEKGQIYAASQSEMLDMDDDPNGATLRKVKLTPEDHIEFDDFVELIDHQKDIVNILHLNADVSQVVDELHHKDTPKGNARKFSVVSASPQQDGCCSIL